MEASKQHSDPFAAWFEELAERIAREVAHELGAELDERIRTAVEGALMARDQVPPHRGGVVDSEEARAYVEPGPNSPRKYFDPEELARRWKWGKTKIYELTEEELPYWKNGNLKRYFWAHVWAFEGRITWEEAHRIHALQAQKVDVLPTAPAHLTRIR